MNNWVRALLGALSEKKNNTLLSPLLCCLILAGCASSNVSRDAAANIDFGVQNARSMADNASDTNLADSYQNSSNATKGAFIGGAAGGITGAFTSGFGLLPGAATGAILGASYGSYIDSNVTIEDHLINRGVTLVVLGDQVLVVIPSSKLFDPWSARIRAQAYSTLGMVSQYLNGYTKMLVKVTGYTARTGTKSIDLALSKQQADQVSRALLARGLNARVVYAEGCGGCRIVEKNTGDWDSDNYRIEITVEKEYV